MFSIIKFFYKRLLNNRKLISKIAVLNTIHAELILSKMCLMLVKNYKNAKSVPITKHT
jgi:hypothetical protein